MKFSVCAGSKEQFARDRRAIEHVAVRGVRGDVGTIQFLVDEVGTDSELGRENAGS
jgi:hypothetical protein